MLGPPRDALVLAALSLDALTELEQAVLHLLLPRHGRVDLVLRGLREAGGQVIATLVVEGGTGCSHGMLERLAADFLHIGIIRDHGEQASE